MARGKQVYPDGHRLAGDEYWSETGRGIVQNFVEPPVGDRNVRVEFKATHSAAVTKPISGWLDTTNTAAMELVRNSFVNHAEIAYRVEVHRKYAVSRDVLYDDLSPDQKVRELAWVGSAHPEQPTQRPQEAAPPQQPAQQPAAAPAGSQRPQRPQQQPSSPPQGDPAEQGLSPTRPPQQRRARIDEGRPWQEQNSDGSPNLGAYAVTGAVQLIDVAVDLMLALEWTPTGATVTFVATRLMEACDEIQAGVRPDGRADRMDNSHSRARDVIKTTLKWLPFPLVAMTESGELDPNMADQVHGWHAKTVKAGIALLQLGLDLSGLDWRTGVDHDRQAAEAERAERDRRAKIEAEWPNMDEFKAAHATYTKLMKEGLADDVKRKVKEFKDREGIGWPLTPGEYQRLTEKIQECIRAAAAPPCESCGENPCVCAPARQPVNAGNVPACSCGGAGCEQCAPF